MGGGNQKSPSSGLSEERRRRIRLLLVDDEKAFLNVLSNRLRKRRMEVQTAYSGETAIRSLRKNDFDVAVVDLKMEDMSGMEVLHIFKKMAPEMPIIILTGHGSEEALKEGMLHGACDYLMKPCDIEDLLLKIKRAVRLKP